MYIGIQIIWSYIRAFKNGFELKSFIMPRYSVQNLL